MKIIPAIDLYEGKCVRLSKGNFNKKTVYESDPLLVAKRFENDGAKYIHIVDLDGAKSGKYSKQDIIEKIARVTSLTIQTGGGVRTLNDVLSLLGAGASKVIIGSLSIKDIPLTRKIIKNVSSKNILFALDVKISSKGTPYLTTNGWLQDNSKTLWDIFSEYSDLDPFEILCTDISRDGEMTGPSLELYSKIKASYPNIKLQASGGVRSLSDLIDLSNKMLDGAIIGRALYEKEISLMEALNVS